MLPYTHARARTHTHTHSHIHTHTKLPISILCCQHWDCTLFFTIFHYVLGANYMWIFVEALYLHMLIWMAVFSERTGLKFYIVFGWGDCFSPPASTLSNTVLSPYPFPFLLLRSQRPSRQIHASFCCLLSSLRPFLQIPVHVSAASCPLYVPSFNSQSTFLLAPPLSTSLTPETHATCFCSPDENVSVETLECIVFLYSWAVFFC